MTLFDIILIAISSGLIGTILGALITVIFDFRKMKQNFIYQINEIIVKERINLFTEVIKIRDKITVKSYKISSNNERFELPDIFMSKENLNNFRKYIDNFREQKSMWLPSNLQIVLGSLTCMIFEMAIFFEKKPENEIKSIGIKVNKSIDYIAEDLDDKICDFLNQNIENMSKLEKGHIKINHLYDYLEKNTNLFEIIPKPTVVNI